jgi:60 kDa SS-A/Ro ribonucleoprotein
MGILKASVIPPDKIRGTTSFVLFIPTIITAFHVEVKVQGVTKMTQKSFYTQALQATQQEPAVGKAMVRNNAGGYAFQVSPETRLDRFLILGTEAGSYYCGARKMTIDNAETIREMIEKRGVEVVRRVAEVSQSGRTPKNDPALFVMALCFAFGDMETKKAARENLSKVARTATHFFLFLQYATALRGWGRALKTAAAGWYMEKNASDLAYQAAKYRNREEWEHHDVLNLTHVKTPDPEKQALFRMIVDKNQAVLEKDDLLRLVEDCSREQISASDYYKLCLNTAKLEKNGLVSAVRKFRLPHEVLPSEALAEPQIWRTLLEADLPMTALIRNIGRMASLEIFDDDFYVDILRTCLGDPERLEKARIHPLNLLTAWKTYSRGCGLKGSLSWHVDRRVKDILEDAFYLSFKTVRPTGKRILIGLDVSGSMTGMAWSGLSAMEVSAVLCMAVARSEQNYTIMAFSHVLQDVRFGKNSSLDEALNEIRGMNFGCTDCALPMIYAQKHKIRADAFVVYTDNETWHGKTHPFQALKDYRAEMGIDAKLIVAGITATDFSIADPSDAGMLDVVGFDSAVPQVVSDFIRH